MHNKATLKHYCPFLSLLPSFYSHTMMILLLSQLLLFHIRMCFWIKSKFAPSLFLVVLCHMFNTSFGFPVYKIDHFRGKLVEKVSFLKKRWCCFTMEAEVVCVCECKKVRLPYIKWDAGQRILNRIAQRIIYERMGLEKRNDSIVWSWKKWLKHLLIIKRIRHDFWMIIHTHITWFAQEIKLGDLSHRMCSPFYTLSVENFNPIK